MVIGARAKICGCLAVWHLVARTNHTAPCRCRGFLSPTHPLSPSQLVLKQVEAPPLCTTAFVVPDSSDDWEILELNAAVFEEQILNQVPGLFFPQQGANP